MDGANYLQPPGWMWLLMLIGFTGFCVVVALVVPAIIRGGRRQRAPLPPSPPRAPHSPPLRILDKRFARGEIDAEEYAERRRVLGQHP